MLRRLQRVGAQTITAIWQDMQAPCTPSQTADWLEVAAGRLQAWKGSSARARVRWALEFVKAWYPGLDLDRLAVFRSEAQAELVAMEDALVAHAAAIADYADTSIFVPHRAEEPFQASRRPAATSSQPAVRLGVRGVCIFGHRAAIAWAPTR